MIDDPDIWNAASLLIKRHGADATMVAGARADDMLAVGDVEGYGVWRRIFAAAADLARTEPAEDERVN